MRDDIMPHREARGLAAVSWLGAALTALLTLALPAPASAASPGTILLEGYVHSAAGPAPDGNYKLTFALYSSKTAAAPFWQESGVEVAVAAGYFAHAIGSQKAIEPALLSNAAEVWLGLAVGTDPELPRGLLHAVPFALRAQIADAASSLLCTGCVKVSSLAWDSDIDLAGQSLKANGISAKLINGQTVVAQEFVGDGSKLTGIALPSGSCPSGQVVSGIAANGALICVKQSSGGGGGDLTAISGGSLAIFDEIGTAPVKDVPIPDNTGLDALSTISLDDAGAATSLSVSVDVENTDLSTLAIVLLPPDDKKTGYTLCDPCGAKGEKIFKGTFPVPLTPKSGDLLSWIGKSPKGAWNLKVKDTGFCIPQVPGNEKMCDVNKGTDGWLHDWSITVQTATGKNLAVSGQLVASNGVRVGSSAVACSAKVAGLLRYSEGAGLQLCHGGAWKGVTLGN